MTQREVFAWARRRHVWIVSPHPCDAILGIGGLMAALSGHGAHMTVVAVTDGTGSQAEPHRLPQASIRTSELRHALNAMDVVATIVRAGLPEGAVASHRANLTAFLSSHIEEGDLVFVTWRLDGQADHEATAHAAIRSANDVGATLVEYPVRLWQWAHRDENLVQWQRAKRIELDERARARKREAMGQLIVQSAPDENTRPFEVVFCS